GMENDTKLLSIIKVTNHRLTQFLSGFFYHIMTFDIKLKLEI
ncbi:15397_t:CDS:1, partial [Funneliformis geosporum]